MKRLVLLFAPILAVAQTPERYGTGLPATGSDKPAHTIFTNPGENASNSVNISFATPVGMKAYVQLTDGSDTILYESKGTLCNTFDSINSKLGDNTDVYERHVFDRHAVTITGLNPDSKHTYRIVTSGINGTQESEERFFKTALSVSQKYAFLTELPRYTSKKFQIIEKKM